MTKHYIKQLIYSIIILKEVIEKMKIKINKFILNKS